MSVESLQNKIVKGNLFVQQIYVYWSRSFNQSIISNDRIIINLDLLQFLRVLISLLLLLLIQLAGWLTKHGGHGFRANWKRRWYSFFRFPFSPNIIYIISIIIICSYRRFVLTEDHLFYFKGQKVSSLNHVFDLCISTFPCTLPLVDSMMIIGI